MAKLSVGRVINVDVFLSPKAVPRRSFGVLCIAGDSPRISGAERVRVYTSADAVAEDFGMSAPEYHAAVLYFGQKPKPKKLIIGRWFSSNERAFLVGGKCADIAAFQKIQNGSFNVEINGLVSTITDLDFSSCTNCNGVAAKISEKLVQLSSQANCIYTGEHFELATVQTGKAAFLGFCSKAENGVDVASLLGLTGDLALPPIGGFEAETPAECAAALADISSEWYGLTFATKTKITKDDYLATAAFIEAAGTSRVFGITLSDERAKKSTYTADIGTALKNRGYSRTLCCYSRVPFAVASVFGRAFTVDFTGSKTTLTLKFKQLPGVEAETLKESEAVCLSKKNINFFAQYDNSTAIFEEGVMSNGAFFDEIHGTDWLQNAIQTGLWNLLYQSKTKVPQTEDGVTRLTACVASVINEGVNNGLVAPGIWRSDGFGQLAEGDYLPTGYYIYSQPIDEQPQEEREARKSPPIQCAVKLAGAIHSADVSINVNR